MWGRPWNDGAGVEFPSLEGLGVGSSTPFTTPSRVCMAAGSSNSIPRINESILAIHFDFETLPGKQADDVVVFHL